MKIKKRYPLILTFIAIFAIYYDQHGWVWNPWASTRMVWAEPNPKLIGQTFSITAPAIYREIIESQPIPLRKMGVVNDISLDKNQIVANKPGGFFKRIQPLDVFTIEKIFWTELSVWKQLGAQGRVYAIVKNTNNLLFTFDFDDFQDTNRPELRDYHYEVETPSIFHFQKNEIAYKNR